MKLRFIPNWNGHLYLQEYNDNSVRKLYSSIEYQDKKLIEIEKNNITKTNKIIEGSFEENSLYITGDHSNTYPLVKAFAKKNDYFSLVIFDAHPDVEISTDTVSHEDYLRNLIEENIIESKNVYLFGIRTFSRTEFEYLQKRGINYFTITDILKDKNKINMILSEIKGPIYLSLDIDVLDPDYAPATYYKEWCGLKLEEFIDFITIVKENTKLVDICEYYEPNDEDGITFENMKKLINIFLN